jgi:hypothetical protein
VFAIGKRPWRFGTGLQYDSGAASTESIVLTVPYGPLDIGIGYYPYRFVGTSSINFLGISSASATVALADPYDLITVTPGISRQYFSRADKSGTLSTDILAYVTYSNGPLQAGVIGNYGTFHIGPEAPLVRMPGQVIFRIRWTATSNSTLTAIPLPRTFLTGASVTSSTRVLIGEFWTGVRLECFSAIGNRVSGSITRA